MRQKLTHARMILENTLNTIGSITAQAERLAQVGNIPSDLAESFHCQLGNISSDIRNYFLTSCKLLSLSDDIRSMVSYFRTVFIYLSTLILLDQS